MRIVDATWELRNLGRKTLEVSLDETDFCKVSDDICEAVFQTRKQYKPEYMVVKIPTGTRWLGDEFFRLGYFHAETQIHLKALRADAKIFLQRYADQYRDTYAEEASLPSEQGYICDEIRKGVFTTDRISIDPKFNVEIANNRYANWIGDVIQAGGATFTHNI